MEKKIAVVTGATRGIGEAISRDLALNGYFVIGLSRGRHQRNVSHANVQLLSGVSGVLLECDITNQVSVNSVMVKIREYGHVDLLVNNAGITSDNFFHKMDAMQWFDVVNTNLNALFYITQPIYKMMRERRFGKIINISSVNGQKGQAGQVNYSASKSGVHGFTMALAQEGARSNILVNTVSPGYTNTEMMMTIKDDILSSIKSSIPLARLAEVSEIANVVSFLASDKCTYMTGANIPINGGLFIG